MAGDRRVESGCVPAQSATRLPGVRGRALERPLHRSPAAADGLTPPPPRDCRGAAFTPITCGRIPPGPLLLPRQSWLFEQVVRRGTAADSRRGNVRSSSGRSRMFVKVGAAIVGADGRDEAPCKAARTATPLAGRAGGGRAGCWWRSHVA
jgi:hypothetical protein